MLREKGAFNEVGGRRKGFLAKNAVALKENEIM